MPPLPLIDLSTIDPGRLQFTAADLQKLMPHRGEMALLEGLVHLDRERQIAVGLKHVRPDEFWAEGHFPGNPIMPGIVMIEASGQLAICLYKLCVPDVKEKLIVFGGIDDVRFRGVVRPGARVLLVGQGIENNRRLAKCRTQAIVDGKIVYEGTILGIPT